MYDLSTFMLNVAVLSVELGPVGLAAVFHVCILPVFLNYGHFTLFVIVLLFFWCVFAPGFLSSVVRSSAISCLERPVSKMS